MLIERKTPVSRVSSPPPGKPFKGRGWKRNGSVCWSWASPWPLCRWWDDTSEQPRKQKLQSCNCISSHTTITFRGALCSQLIFTTKFHSWLKWLWNMTAPSPAVSLGFFFSVPKAMEPVSNPQLHYFPCHLKSVCNLFECPQTSLWVQMIPLSLPIPPLWCCSICVVTNHSWLQFCPLIDSPGLRTATRQRCPWYAQNKPKLELISSIKLYWKLNYQLGHLCFISWSASSPKPNLSCLEPTLNHLEIEYKGIHHVTGATGRSPN